MIAMIAAMKIEADALSARFDKAVQEHIGDVLVTRGQVKGKDYVVVKCGVGLVAAAAATAAVIERYHPSALINVGVAGGIGLPPMTVVIPDRVAQWNMDTSIFGDPRGYISDLRTVFLPCDKSLTTMLSRHGACVAGTIISGDKFLSDAQEIKDVTTYFEANCFDMESAAIVHVAHLFAVPVAVIRVISDNGEAVDFSTFALQAAKISAEHVWDAVENA